MILLSFYKVFHPHISRKTSNFVLYRKFMELWNLSNTGTKQHLFLLSQGTQAWNAFIALTRHSSRAWCPDVAPQCLQHLGSAWLLFLLDPKTVADASFPAGSRAFLSSSSPGRAADGARTLTGTRTHVQTGVVRHALMDGGKQWIRPHRQFRATALAPFFFFSFVSQHPLLLACSDNFSLAHNCSTRRDAARNNGDSPRDCVRSRGSHCSRRKLSVRFSSAGWGKNKTKHLANSCTGPATRSSSALLPANLCSSVRSLFHQFKVYRTGA